VDGLEHPWAGEWSSSKANAKGDLGSTPFSGLFEDGCSAEGVHDLAGNVWEWQDNRYGPDDGGVWQHIMYLLQERFSPGARRAVRGGSWNNHPLNCRASYRNRNTPGNRNNNQGFRVAFCHMLGGRAGRQRPAMAVMRVDQGRPAKLVPLGMARVGPVWVVMPRRIPNRAALRALCSGAAHLFTELAAAPPWRGASRRSGGPVHRSAR